MAKQKILFIDRDGTLIEEPVDQQVDSIAKLKLQPQVIPALLSLQAAGYTLVMVTNQDGLGTSAFPTADFELPHHLLLDILQSQQIHITAVHICPHKPEDNCDCRKPKLGLVMDYLRQEKIDFTNSYVIGDRETDLIFAKNLGIRGIHYGKPYTWMEIVRELTMANRRATVSRITKETDITATVDLDHGDNNNIQTGIGFFDHMLEQLAKHGGFSLQIKVNGDLQIDEHHTVEDTALTLGQALRQALSDKRGIHRYGFLLPMDEALTEIALDLSGRPYFVFTGNFNREKVGELPTELVPHFFRSLGETLGANLHIKVTGENSHHMVECVFKGVGRALRMAMKREGHDLPSTKGTL